MPADPASRHAPDEATLPPHDATAHAPATASRRTFLRASGAAAVGLVAGCLERPTVAAPDHPALTGLAGEPWLGAEEPEDERFVVVFEDPSCPVCRLFEERTYPAFHERLVATGRAGFVSRGFLAAAPWGRAGLRLLEATFDRDEAAFWGLRAHLFAEQRVIASEEVLYLRARPFLETTSLDADRVVAAASGGRYGGAVDRDVAAARAAGVPGTPTFFLFEGGEYVTKIEGAPSYELLASTMGV